jgi:hypothetical protein
MSARLVRIGRAKTGLGLFAVKPIAKKAYIAAYRGKRISNKKAQTREWRDGAKYMFELNSRWTIDGSSRHNLGRYINHACKPNAEPIIRKGKIVFVATRKIKPEEEITFDYGKEYFDCFIKALGCRCASCVTKRRLKRRELREKQARRLAREQRQALKLREERKREQEREQHRKLKLREALKRRRELERRQALEQQQALEQRQASEQQQEREQRVAA